MNALIQFSCSLCQVKEAVAISLKGATVLELGAGMGLCGLLAAQLGARAVVITDCSYVGLKVLLRNCNDARGVVQVLPPSSKLKLPSLCPNSHFLRCGAEIWVLPDGCHVFAERPHDSRFRSLLGWLGRWREVPWTHALWRRRAKACSMLVRDGNPDRSVG